MISSQTAVNDHDSMPPYDVIGNEERILALAEKYLAIILRLPLITGSAEDSWRKGGYLCLASLDSGVPLLARKVGDLNTTPAEKRLKYLDLSQEKSKRLAFSPGYFSSYQTRNPTRDQWGGAIRTLYFILSFSGLPELADEALCILIAEELGVIPASWVSAIIRESRNAYYRDAKSAIAADTAT